MIPDASQSSSFPSEPPDIRNWFPSYKFESFVLDTYDDVFGGCESNENECGGDKFVGVGGKRRRNERNLNECRRNDEGNRKLQDQFFSRTPDSACSLSLLSEPPNIRNWFSSCVHESPVLDTHDDFKESVIKERKLEKEEYTTERSEEKGEKNSDEFRNSRNIYEVHADGEKLYSFGIVECKNSFEDTCANDPSNEILDSSQSSSILSELPNIRNWFFSYAYESPQSNRFVDKETERKEVDFVNQHNNKEKSRNLWKIGQTRITEEASDEKGLLNGFMKFNSSLREDELEHKSPNEGSRIPGKGNSSAQDNLCYDRRQSGISSTKNLEKGSLNDEYSPCKQRAEQKFLQEADFVSCQKNTNSSNYGRNMISPTKLIRGKDLAENLENKAQTGAGLVSAANKMNFVQVAGDIMRKSTHVTSDRENVGKKVPRNDFVTTKKNRNMLNDENSTHKPQNILSECSGKKRLVPSDCGNDVMKRKVLSERTNLEHIDAFEITGKWRCPQKSKPNAGPPLKQLRLEQWVQRL